MSAVQTLEFGGRKFVVIPETEYKRLVDRRESGMPPKPKRFPDGTYPAMEAVRVSIARGIIEARCAIGMSQAELARRAGVRVETLNRLEKAKHTADVATMDKINKALDDAGAP